MVIKGKVTSGLGNASFWVKKIEEFFLKKEGINLFYGTLNVKLQDEYTLKTDFIIKPEEYGGTQNVFVQKCELFGNKSFIVRAEQTAHKTDVVEIVSNINFREKYNLKNEDLIEIVV